MIQVPLIAEDIPAGGLGIGKGSAVGAAHDADVLVQEIEAYGTAIVVRGSALPGEVGGGDAVGPEETVGCAGAEGGDGLAH